MPTLVDGNVTDKELFEQMWFLIGASIHAVMLAGALSATIAYHMLCVKPTAPDLSDARSPPGAPIGAARTPRPSRPSTQMTGVQPRRTLTHDEAVLQMLEMGFEFEVARAALEQNNWDVRRAVTAGRVPTPRGSVPSGASPGQSFVVGHVVSEPIGASEGRGPSEAGHATPRPNGPAMQQRNPFQGG